MTADLSAWEDPGWTHDMDRRYAEFRAKIDFLVDYLSGAPIPDSGIPNFDPEPENSACGGLRGWYNTIVPNTNTNPAAIIHIDWTEGLHTVCDAWEGRDVTPQDFAKFVAIQQGEIRARDGYCNKLGVTVTLRDGSTMRFRADIDAEFTTLRAVADFRARNYQAVADTGRMLDGLEVPYIKQDLAAVTADLFRQVVDALEWATNYADLAPAPEPTNAQADFCAHFLGL